MGQMGQTSHKSKVTTEAKSKVIKAIKTGILIGQNLTNNK